MIGSCQDCGIDLQGNSNYLNRCPACYREWDKARQSLLKGHYTFPDDPELEPRPGWGPFKFDWLMKPFQPFVEWHDRVTRINSEAQKLGITNKQIVEYTRKQLEVLADKPRNGLQKRWAWAVGFFLSKVNRYFYEGPL
jgi:hypothetical protein